jgi:hypothetical protein
LAKDLATKADLNQIQKYVEFGLLGLKPIFIDPKHSSPESSIHPNLYIPAV